MKLPFFICLLFAGRLTYAQNHDFFWPFGYDNGSADPRLGGAEISYKTNPIEVYPLQRLIPMDVFCGVCSDSSGAKLLFYTNGISIRNRNHNLMQNGNEINPGFIWDNNDPEYGYPNAIGALTIPAPGLKNHYYLFHIGVKIDTGITFAPLYYSLINMNVQQGQGSVVKKNVILIDSFNVKPYAIVKHGNGRDWWLITAKYSKPEYYRFLISPKGITGPFIQKIGPDFPHYEGIGLPIFTPDGNMYIRPDGWNGLWIFDFDRCSGLLSNLRLVPYQPPFYTWSCAASPNSRFLYISSEFEMMQLDLQAPDIGLSLDTLQTYDFFYSPSPPFGTGFYFSNLGPDGKIYVASSGTTLAAHVINNPDLPGLASDFSQHGLPLPKINGRTICHFPNYRLGIWETSPCDTIQLAEPPPSGFTNTKYNPPTVISSESYKIMTLLGRKQNQPTNSQSSHQPITKPDPDYFFKEEINRRGKPKFEYSPKIKSNQNEKN